MNPEFTIMQNKPWRSAKQMFQAKPHIFYFDNVVELEGVV